jgi:hypothetical protein
MMTWGVALFWILLALAAGQAVMAIRFVQTLRRARCRNATSCVSCSNATSCISNGSCPKTAVILCLRGADPFLPACLEGILHQDYPRYDLHIVVDSRDDPAWKIVERVLAQHNAANVQVRPLTARRDMCSLKCSSLVQAVSELDASYEVVALLDADTIAHRTWLSELVAPLADDRVGAATGNRWYMPPSASWGTLVRWAWNAAAVVQMYWCRIPWGGTLAVKMSVVRGGDLLSRWSRAFCEDTMLYGALRRLGCRVAFVPSLMMVNREDCTLAGFCRWMRRQLLTVRLYHPAWPLVVGHGLIVSAAQWIGIASLVTSVGMRDGYAAGWLVAGMGLYWGTMAALLAGMEVSMETQDIASLQAVRGESAVRPRAFSVVRAGAAMLLTQATYPLVLLSAMALREVTWRGVRYRIAGPEDIRLVAESEPCVGSPGSAGVTPGSEQTGGSL